MTDLRQTRQYSQFLSRIGWSIEKSDGLYFFIKRIPVLGSAIKLQRTTLIPFQTITHLCKKYRAFQIIIEPKQLNNKTRDALFKNGYRLSAAPYLPTKSIVLPLVGRDEILSSLKKDARYSIRKSKNVSIREEHSIERFHSIWKNAVGNKRHVLSVHELNSFRQAFGDDMTLLTDENGTAGGMFLCANERAYYWVGFTTEESRKTLAQYQVIWNGILWAKQKGAKEFDFEGIYDSRFPKRGWEGFSHFKRSFGGKEVLYPGSFTKWRLPL